MMSFTIALEFLMMMGFRQTVTAILHLLNMNGTNHSPEKLFAEIKRRHDNGEMSPEVEQSIKQVVYFRKLKAIKELVQLLSLSEADIDIPHLAPRDLIDLIFRSDNLDQIENLEVD